MRTLMQQREEKGKKKKRMVHKKKSNEKENKITTLTDYCHVGVTGNGFERGRFGRHLTAEATGRLGCDRSQHQSISV